MLKCHKAWIRILVYFAKFRISTNSATDRNTNHFESCIILSNEDDLFSLSRKRPS